MKHILLFSILTCSSLLYGQIKIHEDGKVSIGSTSSPLSKVQVFGDLVISELPTPILGSQFSPFIKKGNGGFTSSVAPDYSWYNDYGTGIFHPAAWQLAFSTGFNERMRIDWQGLVGIKTTTPQYDLDVNGTIHCVTFNCCSDRGLKTNITPLENSRLALSQIKSYSYQFKSDTTRRLRHGFIADELEKTLPELVYKDNMNISSIDYISLIPFLVQSINELNADVDELKSKCETLEQITNSKAGTNYHIKKLNSSRNFLQYEIPQEAYDKNTIFIKVFDMQGKQILEQTFNDSNSVSVNTQQLPSGSYIITFYNHLAVLKSEVIIIE